jgi:hypothetical protein
LHGRLLDWLLEWCVLRHCLHAECFNACSIGCSLAWVVCFAWLRGRMICLRVCMLHKSSCACLSVMYYFVWLCVCLLVCLFWCSFAWLTDCVLVCLVV